MEPTRRTGSRARTVLINPTNFGLGGDSGQPKDLFQDGVGLTSIFAPFTNPSSALFRNDAGANQLWQDRYSGISIYNIKWNPDHDSIYVSVRYEGLSSTTKADTLKADMKWQGLVQLMGDVYVASGKKLEIDPGAAIVAAAHQDLRKGGLDTTKVELIVRGHKIAEGESENRILFTSSRDAEFVHFGSGGLNTEGEDDPAAAGDWYGSRLLNGTVSPIANELSYDTFRFGTYAVSVDTSSGDLYNCTFTSNDSADVYLSAPVRGIEGHFSASMNILNCRFTNSGQAIRLQFCNLILESSEVVDCGEADVSGRALVIERGSNIDIS